jgi:hypothetical protein
VKFLLAAGWADLQALAAGTEALGLVPQDHRREARALLEYASGEFALRMLKMAEEVGAHVPSGAGVDNLEEIRSLTPLVHSAFPDVGRALETLARDLKACQQISQQSARA